MEENKKATFFNERFQLLHDCLCEIRSSKEDWWYPLVPIDDFKKHEDAIEAGAVYWKEILYRAHLSVLVCYFKTLRWIDAIQDAKQRGNYYSFCASLRGFIECCTDAFYSLRYVPLTLAIDFDVISHQINKNSGVLTTHQKLEEELIHFTHATKFSNQQKKEVPDFLNAKHVSEYLTSTFEPEDKIDILYSALCQVVHPALQSTRIVLFHTQKNEMIVCGDSFQMEKELIEMMDEEFAQGLGNLFNTVCVNGFTILKLLNKFPLANLNTSFSMDKAIEPLEAWQEIVSLMERSTAKYNQALVTGVYN